MSQIHDIQTDWREQVPAFVTWGVSFARGYLELGMTDAAEHELNRLGNPYQDHPEILLLRGRILLAGKRWEELSEHARHAIRSMPHVPEFYVHAAMALDMLGQHKASADVWETAPEKVRVSGTLRLRVARFEARCGNTAGARHHLARAISLDPRLLLEARRDPGLAPLVGLDTKN